MVLIAIGAVAVLCCAIAFVVHRRTRRQQRTVPPLPEFEPVRPAVRVLVTDEEVREAVARAVECERRSAERSTGRIDRYRRIIGDSPTVQGLGEVQGFESLLGSYTPEPNGVGRGTAADGSN